MKRSLTYNLTWERGRPACAPMSDQSYLSDGSRSSVRRLTCKLSLLIHGVLLSCLLCLRMAGAADLQPETVKAWNAYIESQEKRIAAEENSNKGFLAMDFQNADAAAKERRAVLAGEVSIRRMTPGKGADGDIEVPGGAIHHWRGAVFVPDVPFEFAINRIRHPELETEQQEDVLESRVLERSSPDQYKLYLKLKRSQIITAIYNTEHLANFRKLDDDRIVSRSISIKIAEVEQLGSGREREKPEGHDRGFLWRMNSYWRYQRVPGGVLIECESMTLSRSIPSVLEGLVRPIINNIAKESLERTLRELRQRLVKTYNAPPPKKS